MVTDLKTAPAEAPPPDVSTRLVVGRPYLNQIPHPYQFPDGTRVTIRKVRREDGPPIREMHERLSSASIRYRYNGVHKPSAGELDTPCDLDNHVGAAFVATIAEPRETVIALAQYLADPERANTAEPGIIVEDRFQGLGIGTILFSTLVEDASLSGFSTLLAFVDPTNLPVQQMIKESGVKYEAHYSFTTGLREIRIFL